MNYRNSSPVLLCISTLLFISNSYAAEYSASLVSTITQTITADDVLPNQELSEEIPSDNELPKALPITLPKALPDAIQPSAMLPESLKPLDEITNNTQAETDVIQIDPVEKVCQSIAKKLASVNLDECLQSELTASEAFSAKQTPLLIKEYPPLGKRKPQARILMLGGVHGDEYSSVTIMFKWMQTLDKYHSGLFHWKVSPLVNPDGLLQKKSQRMNANGVDLNRNFDNGISETASLDYWKTRTYEDPRRYPGEKPLSESETRWIQQLIEEFKPDAIVAVHAPYGIVDFDGPHQPPKHLGPLHLHLLGTYPGSLGINAGKQLKIPVVTVELPHAGIMPSKDEVSRIWVDLVAWLRKHVPQQDSQVVYIK